MKLSFTTLGCPDWSMDKILDEAAAMGYDGIEIRGLDGEMLAENMTAFKPGRQQDTFRKLKQHGLALVGFGTSVNFHDATQTEVMIEQGKAAIDVCRTMGIPAIRVFGDKVPTPDEESKIIDQVIAGINDLCAYAEGSGVQVWLESHGDFNRLERFLLLVQQVKYASFGLLWDIEHSDKVYGDNFKTFYEPLRNWIRHVHIKDHKRNSGQFNLCRLGEGDIPIANIVQTMIADGYDGYFSLEWEKKWHPELPEPDIAFRDFIRIMTAIVKPQSIKKE